MFVFSSLHAMTSWLMSLPRIASLVLRCSRHSLAWRPATATSLFGVRRGGAEDGVEEEVWGQLGPGVWTPRLGGGPSAPSPVRLVAGRQGGPRGLPRGGAEQEES